MIWQTAPTYINSAETEVIRRVLISEAVAIWLCAWVLVWVVVWADCEVLDEATSAELFELVATDEGETELDFSTFFASSCHCDC